MRIGTALFISLAVYKYVESYDARTCEIVCSYTEYPGNLPICVKCSDDPPISYDMCYFACGTTKVTKTTVVLLGRICAKCFASHMGLVMAIVCDAHCKKGISISDKNKRLCGKCYIKGY